MKDKVLKAAKNTISLEKKLRQDLIFNPKQKKTIYFTKKPEPKPRIVNLKNIA